MKDNGEELFTFRGISMKLNKNPRYFSNLLSRKPWLFDGVKFEKSGNFHFITETEANKVLSNLKKTGDHLRATPLKVVLKADAQSA